MKRLLALLLAIAMLFGLAGCTQEEVTFTVDVISGVLSELDDGNSQTTAAQTSATVKQTTTTSKQTSTAAQQKTTTAPKTTAVTTATTTKAATTAASTTTAATTSTTAESDTQRIDRDGWYYSADDVSLYIYTYGVLPSNFITKKEAEKLGWEGGSVERYLEGAAIGGDVFGNREGLLPKASGRKYYECDIDTDGGKSRGAKRIVFSNDGLIFYTSDHYETFTLLYGDVKGGITFENHT